jgi:hypothetical protein
VQGSSEQQAEPYILYGEGAAEEVTQQCAKNNCKVSSFAWELAVVVKSFVLISVTFNQFFL